jgi:hypothetical protein
MPLDNPGLKSSIKNLLTEMETKNEDSKDYFAEKLADAIEVFVKSATITVTAGIPVITTGSATTQTGTTTAPGQTTIA